MIEKETKMALIPDAPIIEIKSFFRSKPRYFGVTVRKAKEISAGHIVFENAKADFLYDESRNANTKNVIFKIQHGFVWRNKDKSFYGIDWDNVLSVSGNTFDLNDELKKRGFRWNSESKIWVKP